MKTSAKDYYKILGVGDNAEEPEIKKAFHRLAMEFHPDHNPQDPRAEERFKEISEAYGVLIDPVKRREYDLFRSTGFGGPGGGSSFRYSQRDIFEDMFRNGFARDIFNDLNKEFSRSGYRSGPNFLEAILFGGAAGGLGRILGMIPGPLGRLGYGLRVLQMLGASMVVLNRMRQQQKQGRTGVEEEKPRPNLLDSIKGIFASAPSPKGEDLNVNLSITLPPAEALAGTKKKIAYKVENAQERLVVSIPPGIAPGGKLRIKGKGRPGNGQRGDLILTIQVKSV